MKQFLTDGASPLGKRLIVKLVEQGNQVCALAKSADEAREIEALGGTAILGDLQNIDALRQGMIGTDVLFHNAEYYKPYGTDWRQMELVNVSGTRTVLQVAQALKIPKIVYTNHAVIYGDTQGQAVSEQKALEDKTSNEPSLSHYHRTKWIAFYDIVQPALSANMPITVVTPGHIYGPDSGRYLDYLMRGFYQHHFPFPILFGPRTMLSIIHIDDVVTGHVLAAEKGEIGENYHLSGPAVTLKELVEFWSRITGIRESVYQLPSSLLRSMRPLVNLSLSSDRVPLSPMIMPEMTATLGTTSILDSTKAEDQLGWRSRPIQTGMLESFEEIARTTPARPSRLAGLPMPKATLARLLLTCAVAILGLWLVLGRKNKTNTQE